MRRGLVRQRDFLTIPPFFSYEQATSKETRRPKTRRQEADSKVRREEGVVHSKKSCQERGFRESFSQKGTKNAGEISEKGH